MEPIMSKHNKVNKNNYDQGGRLTPDELARERMRQTSVTGRAPRQENVTGKLREQRGGQGPTRPRTAREE